jgi:hypothetical protein
LVVLGVVRGGLGQKWYDVFLLAFWEGGSALAICALTAAQQV